MPLTRLAVLLQELRASLFYRGLFFFFFLRKSKLISDFKRESNIKIEADGY